jgi:multiple sugar transport system permease protein
MRRRAIAGLVLAGLFVMPFAFMFFASLRPPGLPPPDGFELWPERFTFETYEFVFRLVPLWRQIGNSLFVAFIAVPITVLFASWAGFAIATAPPRRQKALIAVTILAMMVPVVALWVPRFAMMRWVGLTDTLWSLMTPALMATTPFYVLIFGLAHFHVPRDVYEAARLDGWSPFQVWRRVAFPLARPAAFAVAVLAFVSHWANFTDALLYLSSEDRFTVPLGLRTLQTLEPQNFPLLLAGSVVATVPALAAFLAAQRAFFTRTLEV